MSVKPISPNPNHYKMQTDNEEPRINILDLPKNILFLIFSNCSKKDHTSLASTCRSLNKIINDEAFQSISSARLIGLTQIQYRELEKDLESIKNHIDNLNIENKDEILSRFAKAYIKANKLEMAKILINKINDTYIFKSTLLNLFMWDYKVNLKRNINEINSLIEEINQLIDKMEYNDQILKDDYYLELLKAHLLLDQIETARQCIDKIKDAKKRFQAYLELYKKCPNNEIDEEIKNFINQLDLTPFKILSILDFLNICLEINPDYDITTIKDAILFHISNLTDRNRFNCQKIQLLLKFMKIYKNDKIKQITENLINDLFNSISQKEKEPYIDEDLRKHYSTLKSLGYLYRLQFYLQSADNNKAKLLINEISDPIFQFSIIIEFLKHNPNDIQIKNQAKQIITDNITNNNITTLTKISMLMNFLEIYPKDLEKKIQIKSFINEIENPTIKINLLLDLIKICYFEI